jgi:hypothetical protein
MGERQHITYKPCLRCSGTGAVRSALGWFSTVSTFGISSLSGLDDKESCPRCGGGGQVIDKIYLDAHIPRAPAILYLAYPNGTLMLFLDIPIRVRGRDGNWEKPRFSANIAAWAARDDA